MVARITRKRTEWSHEKECGSLPARSDRSTISMTPFAACSSARASSPKHAMQVCDVLDRRPVEVLHGLQLEGLSSRSGASARSAADEVRRCHAVFDPAEDLGVEQFLGNSLTVPFDALVEECRRTALRPNMEDFTLLSTSQAVPERNVHRHNIQAAERPKVYHKCYFDQHLHPLPSAPI